MKYFNKENFLKYWTKENLVKLCANLVQPGIMWMFYKSIEYKMASEMAQIREELLQTKIELLQKQEIINQQTIQIKTQKAVEIVEASNATIFTVNNIFIICGITLVVVAVILGVNYAYGGSSGDGVSGAVSDIATSPECNLAESSYQVLKNSQDAMAESIEQLSENVANITFDEDAQEKLRYTLEIMSERQDCVVEAIGKLAIFCKGMKAKILAIALKLGA